MIDFDKTLEVLNRAMTRASAKEDIDDLAAAITSVTAAKEESAALYKKNEELAGAYKNAILHSKIDIGEKEEPLKAKEAEQPKPIEADDYINEAFKED